MSYRLTAQVIGNEELKRAFDQAPRAIEQELKRALNKTAYKVEERAKANAPHAFGNLAGSINTREAHGSGLAIQAEVGTNIKYAEAMEKGSRPHFPPPKALEAWARLRFGDAKMAWVVARSIARKGTKGRFFFKKAKEESRTDLTENLRTALSAIVGALTR